jgi:DnaJ-class molecular chaperone
VERRFRQLSLRAHPDKNPAEPEVARRAFDRLQEARDAVIRGHELVKQVRRELGVCGGVGGVHGCML